MFREANENVVLDGARRTEVLDLSTPLPTAKPTATDDGTHIDDSTVAFVQALASTGNFLEVRVWGLPNKTGKNQPEWTPLVNSGIIDEFEPFTKRLDDIGHIGRIYVQKISGTADSAYLGYALVASTS